MSNPPGSGTQVFHFNGYSIDTGRRELRRGDHPVEIQPRVFDLLVYLVTHQQRAVDKEELQDAVWPGVVVTETALTRAIMKARKAVGDDANRQEVIKTVHGHGYRFVAELAESGSAAPAGVRPPPSADSGSEAAAPASDSRLHKALWGGLMVLSLLGIFGMLYIGLLLLRPAPTPAGELRVAVLPLEDATGNPELAWARLGLMSYVGNMLGSEGGLATVGDGSVVSLAESLGWKQGLEDTAGKELASRLREVYGATHVLAIELVKEGAGLRMSYTLLDAQGEEKRATMVGDTATDLADGVVRSVQASLLGGGSREARKPLGARDPFNNEAFARGLDLSLQGHCADAISYFRIVMEREPSLFAPRFEYAACERILGENDAAERLLDTLLAEQRSLGPSRELAQVLMTRGIMLNRTGRLDEAEASHHEGLDVARDIGDHDLSARILHNLSIVYEDRGDFDMAEKLLDLAVLDYRAAGRETMPGQVYSARANLFMDRGELVQAREYLDRAIAAFRAAGDQRNEAMMLNNTGYLLRKMGRLDEAEDYHLRSLAMRREIGDRVGVGRVYGQLSALYSARREFQRAAGAAKSAHEVAVQTSDRLYEGTSLAQWAEAELGAGDREAASEHFQRSREVFSAIQDRMRVLQVDVLLARMDLGDGDLDGAEQTGRDVRQQAAAANMNQPEIEAMELLGEVAVARGDQREAIRIYAQALQRVRESSWGAKEAAIATALLNARLEVGDIEEAAPLAGALAGLEPTPDSLKAQARYARHQGQAEQALALMEQAKSLAGEDWDDASELLLTEYRGQGD